MYTTWGPFSGHLGCRRSNVENFDVSHDCTLSSSDARRFVSVDAEGNGGVCIGRGVVAGLPCARGKSSGEGKECEAKDTRVGLAFDGALVDP